MELYRVIIPKDEAWMVAEALGRIEAAHFVDLNKNEQAYDLPYQSRIKLCEEVERKINYLLGKCSEYRIQIHRPASVEVFNRKVEAIQSEMRKARHLLFDALETEVVAKESFVRNMAT